MNIWIGYRYHADRNDGVDAVWADAKPAPIDGARWEKLDTPIGMSPPRESRHLTAEELRRIGWRSAGDRQCEFCDLYEMDGLYPVCDACGRCSDCEHDDDCEEDGI